MQALTNTPYWVWILFAALLITGLQSSKTRELWLLPYFLLPLLIFASLFTLLKLPNPSLAWSVWALAYLSGAIAGYTLQGRWILQRNGWRIRLKGEWLTLTMMMVIFGANFANGLLSAISPSLLATPIFLILFATATGLSSGSFLGRSLRIAFWHG